MFLGVTLPQGILTGTDFKLACINKQCSKLKVFRYCLLATSFCKMVTTNKDICSPVVSFVKEGYLTTVRDSKKKKKETGKKDKPAIFISHSDYSTNQHFVLQSLHQSQNTEVTCS